MAALRAASDFGRGAGGSVRGYHEGRLDAKVERERVRPHETDGVDVGRFVVLPNAGVRVCSRSRVRGCFGERIVHRGVVRE